MDNDPPNNQRKENRNYREKPPKYSARFERERGVLQAIIIGRGVISFPTLQKRTNLFHSLWQSTCKKYAFIGCRLPHVNLATYHPHRNLKRMETNSVLAGVRLFTIYYLWIGRDLGVCRWSDTSSEELSRRNWVHAWHICAMHSSSPLIIWRLWGS